MEWTEVISDAALRNLPFKIETNRYGQIVMSPASNRHGMIRMEIGILISHLKNGGGQQAECAIKTDDGVKVADVAWFSSGFLEAHQDEIAFSAAPEVCVEVLSLSNSIEEIEKKASLYFKHGVFEVWICSENNEMRFIGPNGDLLRSELFPEFPRRIEIR